MKPVISTIKDIYPSSQAEAQKQRYKKAVTAFAEHFGSIGEHRFFSAPGRTEICGNHTDHNHGKVFAASVNLDVIAVVEPTEDDKIVILIGVLMFPSADTRIRKSIYGQRMF